MNFCFFISRRLVVYSEGETSPTERVRIESHLANCDRCCERIQQIRQRIELMQLPLHDPGDELWSNLTFRLSTTNTPRLQGDVAIGHRRKAYRHWLLRPTIAVIALFVIAIMLVTLNRFGLYPNVHNVHKQELDLAGYIELIGTVAAAEPTLKEFPAAPGFTEINRSEAEAKVNFPVIAPDFLPGGYRLEVVRLYINGSFRALQLKYQSKQNSLCVFQLPAASRLIFGEKISEECLINGHRCRLMIDVGCALYPFILGETQGVLIMQEHEEAIVTELMRVFTNQYQKLKHK